MTNKNFGIVRSFVLWACIACFFVFVVFNMLASQLVHPLYFSFVNEERDAVVSFLEKTRSLPGYSRIEDYLSQSIDVLQQDILYHDKVRQETIDQLELVLDQNEKARDVLVSLALLHKQAGNEQMSEEYWSRAQAVDPDFQNRLKESPTNSLY